MTTNAYAHGGLVTTTAPTVPAALTTLLMEHCRLDTNADQADSLTQYLRAAIEMAQERTGQQLFSASYRYEIDAWVNPIRLPLPPLVSVASIKYDDPENIEQTLSNYTVVTSRRPGRITLRETPETSGRPGCIRIAFTCGYGSAVDSLPYMLRQAILLTAAAWFELREAASDRRIDSLPMPVSADAIFTAHQFIEAF